MTIIGYCVRCKKKQEMKDTSHTKNKNKVPMTTGICSICGCKMCRMGGI